MGVRSHFVVVAVERERGAEIQETEKKGQPGSKREEIKREEKSWFS